jgi:hypothetical protein
LSIPKSLNKFQVKVELLDLLRDQEFFLKNIEFCEKQRAIEVKIHLNNRSKDSKKESLKRPIS